MFFPNKLNCWIIIFDVYLSLSSALSWINRKQSFLFSLSHLTHLWTNQSHSLILSHNIYHTLFVTFKHWLLLTGGRLLRAELQNLRKRGALKTGSSLDRPVIIESNRSCARCRTYLGRIINRGAPCRACKLRVCKGCREFTNRTDWVCVVCNKQMWVKHNKSFHFPPLIKFTFMCFV